MVEPVPLRFVLIPVGYLSTAMSAVAAAGMLQVYALMIFTGGLVWFLLVAAIQFVMLVMPDAHAA